MGAGKSTIGELLARRLGVDFVDLDERIVDRSGKSIEQIFKEEGEQGFRRREAEELGKQLSGAVTIVLACGGGIVESEENVTLLRAKSHVFYLDISINEVLRRLAGEGNRPLLQGGDLEETVSSLMARRYEKYLNAAHETVSVDGVSAEELAEGLFERCRKLA
jgi:shikimate kinase